MNALTTSSNFKIINQQILLKTQTGTSTIVLTPYTPISTSFSGKYTSKISTVNLLIEFNNLNKISLTGGCNDYTVNYNAYKSG